MSETTPHDTFAHLLAEYRWANNAIGVAEGDDAKDVAEVQRIGQEIEQLYADALAAPSTAVCGWTKCSRGYKPLSHRVYRGRRAESYRQGDLLPILRTARAGCTMSDLKTHALKLCELAEELQTYIEKAALTGPRSGHTLAAEIMIVKALCSEHGATLTTHGVYVNREALVCAMQLTDEAQPYPDIREAFLSLKQSLK